MSKSWYPVIDYEICRECGACFNKCKHGVYKKEENRPIIIFPEGCRGCQSLCPSGAIQYVGDTKQKDNCNCGCCN